MQNQKLQLILRSFANMMVILDGSQQHDRMATALFFENDKSRSRSPGSMTRSTRVQDIAQQNN